MQSAWKDFQAYEQELRGGARAGCASNSCPTSCCGSKAEQPGPQAPAPPGNARTQGPAAGQADDGIFDDMPPLEPIDALSRSCSQLQQQRQQQGEEETKETGKPTKQQQLGGEQEPTSAAVAAAAGAPQSDAQVPEPVLVTLEVKGPVSPGQQKQQQQQQQQQQRRKRPMIEEVAGDEVSEDLSREWADALAQPPPPSAADVAATTADDLAAMTRTTATAASSPLPAHVAPAKSERLPSDPIPPKPVNAEPVRANCGALALQIFSSVSQVTSFPNMCVKTIVIQKSRARAQHSRDQMNSFSLRPARWLQQCMWGTTTVYSLVGMLLLLLLLLLLIASSVIASILYELTQQSARRLRPPPQQKVQQQECAPALLRPQDVFRRPKHQQHRPR